MKMKPLYIALTIAAVGGVIWYAKKNKATTVQVPTDPAAATGVIPTPKAEESKIINLPDSLIQKTSGNTGILPPVISKQPTSVKVIQSQQPKPLLIKPKGLKGLEDAFILN